MAKVRIKQMDTRVATSGIHLVTNPDLKQLVRKLEPGEVVNIDDDMLCDGDPKQRTLLQVLHDTGKIELVPNTVPVTRPFKYDTPKEAELCSPSFIPREPSEARDRDQAVENVKARLLAEDIPAAPSNRAKTPEDEEIEQTDDSDKEAAALGASRRRERKKRLSGAASA